MKKFISLLLSLGMVVSMAACGYDEEPDGPSGGNSEIENIYNLPGKDKTELKVINFHGGVGSVWIDEAAERFAQLKQNESYATGKKGIYINIDKSMTPNTSQMANSAYALYFDERFSDVNALAQAGLLLPITDIVKDQTRVGGVLEDKLFEQVKGSLKGNDGEYYGLPHYEFYGGMSYNRKVFDSAMAYFAADEATDKWEYPSTKYGSAYMVNDLNTKKSKGPDGEYDTEDDGLPCSLQELIILMDYFKTQTAYDPAIVSGQYQNYINYTIAGLWSALAGKEQMENYYNCTGEIEVIDYENNGGFSNENLFPGIDYIKKPYTKKVTMTESTGYLGNDMVAKYYALAMLEIFEKEGFYSPDSYIPTRNHYDAHKNLYYDGAGQYEKAAMLLEASYWYTESRINGGLNDYKIVTGKNPDNLDLRVMPLPTNCYTEGATGKEDCLLDIAQTFAMINGNIKNNEELKRAAKEFLAFLYSEDELQRFTVSTGMSRAISYELTKEQKENINPFYLELLDKRDNVVYYSGSTKAFRLAKTSIRIELDGPVLKPGGKESPFGYFQGGTKNSNGTYATGAQYVMGLLRITAKEWGGIYTA
ncbi:MAG: hypothetical protein IJ506_08735 [Clostridia bacterium]|nr:hypothetical protein [Clostridia bacterium]